MGYTVWAYSVDFQGIDKLLGSGDVQFCNKVLEEHREYFDDYNDCDYMRDSVAKGGLLCEQAFEELLRGELSDKENSGFQYTVAFELLCSLFWSEILDYDGELPWYDDDVPELNSLFEDPATVFTEIPLEDGDGGFGFVERSKLTERIAALKQAVEADKNEPEKASRVEILQQLLSIHQAAAQKGLDLMFKMS